MKVSNEFTCTLPDMSIRELTRSYLQYTVLCFYVHCAMCIFLRTRSVAVFVVLLCNADSFDRYFYPKRPTWETGFNPIV